MLAFAEGEARQRSTAQSSQNQAADGVRHEDPERRGGAGAVEEADAAQQGCTGTGRKVLAHRAPWLRQEFRRGRDAGKWVSYNENRQYAHRDTRPPEDRTKPGNGGGDGQPDQSDGPRIGPVAAVEQAEPVAQDQCADQSAEDGVPDDAEQAPTRTRDQDDQQDAREHSGEEQGQEASREPGAARIAAGERDHSDYARRGRHGG